GFWPDVAGNEAALELMVRAIEQAGLRPLDDVAISLDVAANQFYRSDNYHLRADATTDHPAQWVERLTHWCARYPVVFVEDPWAEQDRHHYAAFRSELHAIRAGSRVVGDDLVVTNATRIEQAAGVGLIDAALIKPNQAGTVTETREAFDACRAHGVLPIVSARSPQTQT